MIKISGKSKKCYIKDKAIIKSIKAHSQRQNIDFSKIKIPSFLDINENELKEEDFLSTNSKNIISAGKENKKLGMTIFPAFKFPKKDLAILDLNKNNFKSSISRFSSILFN